MKEELMLLGFISLMLSATSSSISSICIESKYYNTRFSPCTISAAEEDHEDAGDRERSFESQAIGNCKRIYTWRGWECEARTDMDNTLTAITKELTIKRQSTFVYSYNTGVWSRSNILVWLTSFFRQFGKSVTRTDYLTLRRGFITNHNLLSSYDFHSYMIRCMEEEFKRIVGISAPLWAVVIAFMLLNVNGAKLQHVIATLAIENAGIHDSFEGVTLRPRDELFWLNKPELLLLMIHFILFENAFELASFVWFWWQFGYDSCFLRNHLLVYIRLILGFAGQFLCSYSTLPLYALVTQMGTHYKAALIPPRVRETIDVWGKAAKRRRKHGAVTDDFSLRSSDNSISVCKNHDSNHFEGCNVSQTHVQVDSNSPEPTFTDEQNK